MAKALKTKTERTPKAAPSPEAFSLISSEKLLAIYSAMVKCRMLEQRATLLFQEGKLASDLHASSGHEACAAAIATELGPNDALSIAPGDWLPAFVKGITLENLFRAVAPAAATDNSKQPPLPADLEYKGVIVAGEEGQRIATIRDRAEAIHVSEKGSIVAAYLPCGPALPRAWHGILTAAASKRLPIVFVRYSVSETAARETPAGRKAKNPEALIHGVPAIAVDALDAVAVYRVAYEAIIRARQGRGATLLECSFPAVANNSLNRSSSPDPVSAMESYLTRKGIEPELKKRETVTAFNRDLELATRFLNQ